MQVQFFFGQVSNHNKYKLQNYSEFCTSIQNSWASNQVTVKNYKTTATFPCKSKNFFWQVLASIGKYEQVKTTKLQPFCRASPIFLGQVSNHNKYKLRNYSEFFAHIQKFWTSKQVTSKNYKTTGNFSRMLKKIFGQVSK